MSKFQKRRHRLRLRHVDGVIETLDKALAKQGKTLPSVERWKSEMPTEEMMMAKDKYTMFDRKEKRYRKGIHSMFPPTYLLIEEARRSANDCRRAAQMDESVATIEPSWILSENQNGSEAVWD